MDKREHRIAPDINVWSYIIGSLVDYPGHPAITLFTKDCNMTCGFCHNIKTMNQSPVYSSKYIGDLIKSIPMVDSLVITGGEPCIQPKLMEFMFFVKEERNFKIKLDTNGTMPDVLETFIENKMIDFIAMDIKCDFDDYNKYGYLGSVSSLRRSVSMIRDSGIPYQFRTTDFNLTEKDRKFINLHFPDIKMQRYVKVVDNF